MTVFCQKAVLFVIFLNTNSLSPYLCLEVSLRRSAAYFHSSNVKVHEDVLKRRSVSGLTVPAHLYNEPEAIWARRRYREVQRT